MPWSLSSGLPSCALAAAPAAHHSTVSTATASVCSEHILVDRVIIWMLDALPSRCLIREGAWCLAVVLTDCAVDDMCCICIAQTACAARILTGCAEPASSSRSVHQQHTWLSGSGSVAMCAMRSKSSMRISRPVSRFLITNICTAQQHEVRSWTSCCSCLCMGVCIPATADEG
jgi:hypothetical protein